MTRLPNSGFTLTTQRTITFSGQLTPKPHYRCVLLALPRALKFVNCWLQLFSENHISDANPYFSFLRQTGISGHRGPHSLGPEKLGELSLQLAAPTLLLTQVWTGACSHVILQTLL